MKLLKSQSKNDCVALAISMLGNLPYPKVRNRLKKRYGYKLTNGGGVKSYKIKTALEEFFPDKIEVIEEGTYSNMGSMFGGNKGVFSIKAKVLIGEETKIMCHLVAWNGFMVYDSNCTRPMFQTEYQKYASQYYEGDLAFGYKYKTNIFRRGLSLVFNFLFHWI